MKHHRGLLSGYVALPIRVDGRRLLHEGGRQGEALAAGELDAAPRLGEVEEAHPDPSSGQDVRARCLGLHVQPVGYKYSEERYESHLPKFLFTIDSVSEPASSASFFVDAKESTWATIPGWTRGCSRT